MKRENIGSDAPTIADYDGQDLPDNWIHAVPVSCDVDGDDDTITTTENQHNA